MMDAEDADGDVLLVAYGSVYRCARAASQAARARGWKVGSCKLGTLWPFPGEEVKALSASRRVVVVMENNMGQLYPYVKAETCGNAETVFLPPQVLGELHDVEYVLESIREYVR